MPRLDKLTIKAQEALQAAQEMGARSGQQQIEPLHLLWALIAASSLSPVSFSFFSFEDVRKLTLHVFPSDVKRCG